MKAAIYSRKSKFTGKGESIENQIELCKKYAHTHFDIEEKDIYIYEDEGFSGGNTNRPQFQMLLNDAKKKKFDVLICYRLDRLSRSVGDFTNTMDEIQKYGVSFVSIREQFDTSTPMGRAMMYIASVFSQLERETLTERIKDNMMQLAKTGRWLGGITPTGFYSKEVSHIDNYGKQRKMFKLSPIKQELVLVELIYDKFLELKSLTKVDQYCLMNSIKSKNNISYTRYSIRYILSNPVYAVADKTLYTYLINNGYEVSSYESQFNGQFGLLVYNKTNQTNKVSSRFKSKSELIVAVGAHKGIISSEKWIAVQKLLHKNKSKSYYSAKNSNSLLSGILRCGKCGSYMRPKNGRISKDGTQIYYYMCTMKERSKRTKCDMKNVKGNDLDALIISRIKQLSMYDSQLHNNIDTDKIKIKTVQDSILKEITLIKNDISSQKKSIDNLVATLTETENSTARKYIVKQIEAMDLEVGKLNERLVSLLDAQELNNSKENSLDTIIAMLATFNDNINDIDVESKRAFLQSIVDKVIWDGESAELVMFGSDSAKKSPPPTLIR